MALAAIRPTGLKQGDLVQFLYEIIAAIIAVSSAPTTTWTITVLNKAGTATGSAVKNKILSPNGWNQAYFVQALYETAVYGIASLAGWTEVDITGRVANLALTETGGTTSKTYWLKPNGISQGNLCQLLYEIAEVLIDDVAGYASTRFTLDVENKAGTLAGVSG